VSVQAIAGNHAVLLALDAEPAVRQDLLGFAIGREDATGRVSWMRGFKFFEQVVANPQPGERRSTLEHPIQSFLWGHYSATPDQPYTYVIRPLHGAPGALVPGTDVRVAVRTEPVDRGTHSILFNRGAIPSQAFADRFDNQGPADPDDPTAADVQWLSRGLLAAALDFIGQARGARFSLRVAAYEFSYPPVLEALRAAAASGADVQVVYEDGQRKVKGVLQDTSTTVGNRAAIAATGLDTQANLSLIPRRNRRAIPHNKFMILLDNGHPIEVWTGSTNLTPSGFLGQTNVGHLVRDEPVARVYLDYWTRLAQDPMPDPFQAFCSQLSAHPGDALPPSGTTLIFSPRERSRMLDWYGDRIEGAQQTVMLTAAFGVTRRLAERFDNDRDFLRFLLMERRNRSEETQAMLERDRDTVIALGSKLNRDAIELGLDGHRLDEWFAREEHFRRRGHVFYIHTKILLVDVMSDDPLVFTGSANFSPASLLSNDENMLLIRGDLGVADVYVSEFVRLFNHIFFRYIATKLAREGANEPTRAVYLDPTDGWVARHFTTGRYHCRRRELFRARF
jgi:phosphatidylserine/phosphatidylglycerophosphate/cardiolipin synthase-like enzyme